MCVVVVVVVAVVVVVLRMCPPPSELFTAEKKYNAAIEEALDVHKKGQSVVQVRVNCRLRSLVACACCHRAPDRPVALCGSYAARQLWATNHPTPLPVPSRVSCVTY